MLKYYLFLHVLFFLEYNSLLLQWWYICSFFSFFPHSHSFPHITLILHIELHRLGSQYLGKTHKGFTAELKLTSTQLFTTVFSFIPVKNSQEHKGFAWPGNLGFTTSTALMIHNTVLTYQIAGASAVRPPCLASGRILSSVCRSGTFPESSWDSRRWLTFSLDPAECPSHPCCQKM